jgi:hypothetical protein
VALSGVIVAALSAGPAAQQLDLRARTLPGGGQPFAVVAHDLDGDGNADLTVTNSSTSRVSVYLGAGDGSFSPPLSFETGRRPRGIVAADFNRDGTPDLAVAATDRNRVFVHLGRGHGRFQQGTSVPVGRRPFMLTVLDLDSDGALDIAVANEGEAAGGEALSILLGDGKGEFSSRSLSTGRYASDVAAADFNRDGKPDLAVATWGSNDVAVHLGRGDGTFLPPKRFTYAQGHGLYLVLAADLDRDGSPDMVWNDLRRSGLYVLYGDGTGGFPRTRLLATGRGVRHAVARDLNGDGWLDLVSANTGAGDVSVILADGRGDFLPAQTIVAGVLPRTVAAADLNGDRRPDLVVANMKSDDLHVFLNHGVAGGDGGPLAPGVRSEPQPSRDRAARLRGLHPTGNLLPLR